MKIFLTNKPLLAGLLLTALAGCGGSNDSERYETLPPTLSYASLCGLPPASSETYRVLEPTGGRCIAKTSFALSDPRRNDPYSSNPLDRREVELKIWYPVAAGSSQPRAEYASKETAQAMNFDFGPNAPRTNARAGGPMPDGQRYPLILLAPGLGAVVEMYTALAEDLASHGYIVVGINHGRISGVIVNAEGKIIRNERVPDDEGSDEMLDVLVKDQAFVLDWLAQRNADSGHPLGGHLDLARIGAYGHSIGGATSLQLQRQDVRVRAAINLDGTVYGDLSQPWSKPFLILASERPTDPSYLAIMKLQKDVGRSEVLAGFGHGDFSDQKFYVEQYNRNHPVQMELDPTMFHSVRGEDALRLVREKARLFFRTAVK
ncbi:hypothetical protein [Massilia sp. BJB1822]|uniref:alpha/beta hydrolase family protein n=1 Tax=Massilia sp. BJB1822 TaxID=2744470 RepID=UPI001593E3D8|nr:hypothetical protein [Massilia sp. BJB1822]NVD97781.1 hypothetical protein [Massilia sp. BJB1822]